MAQYACPHGFLDTSKYSSPLPMIGIYIAAASLLCFLGIAIDTFKGFWERKSWFPCKYYSLNAATLTVLAIATKLPIDLSSPMPSGEDQLTKLTGSIMICVSMGFFMPSLGDMTRAELLSNLIAVSIMAITLIVNICIQIGTGVIFAFLVEHIIIMACILVLLVVLWFSSLSLAMSFRGVFDLIFIVNAEPNSLPNTFEGTKDRLEGIWKIAHVVNPQYVLGRSSNCITVSLLCGISMIVLFQAILRSFLLENSSFCHGVSDYGFSTWVVVACQTSFIVIGGVATTTRWFVLAFHVSRERFGTWKDLFVVEKYYFRWLRGLKNQHLLGFDNGFILRKLSGLNDIIVDLLIVSQKGIILIGKSMCFSSMWCAVLFKKFLVCLGCNREKSSENASNVNARIPPTIVEKTVKDISTMLGERDLVPWLLSNSTRDMPMWKNKCERSIPSHLIQLLSKWPTSGTCSLDYPYSVYLVMMVRLAMLLSPSNEEHTHLLVTAVNEGLEIIYFVAQHSGNVKFLYSSKLSLYFWLDRNDPDHWLNEVSRRLSTELKSIDTIEVEVILENLSTLCIEFSERFYDQVHLFENCEASCLQEVVLKAITEGPFESTNELIDFLEETTCSLLRYFLENLPQAIIKEFIHYPMEKPEENVRRAMYFLSKVEKLQDHIEFNWQEVRDSSAP